MNAKKGISHYSSEPNVGEGIFISDVGKIWKKGFFSRGSEKYAFFISGHALRWVWHVKGDTFRKADHESKMNNWPRPKRTWRHFHGAKIVLNLNTCEIWLKSGTYRSVKRLIYASWARADAIAREFSEFARMPLTASQSEHLANCKGAHLVLENPEMNAILVPAIKNGLIKKDMKEAGWEADGSHERKAEGTGKRSIEHTDGLKWLCTDYPWEWSEKEKTDAQRWDDLEAAIALLSAQDAKLAEGLAKVAKTLSERR